MRICLLTNNTRMDNGWGRSARELIEALRGQGIAIIPMVEEGGGFAGEKVVLTHAQAHPAFVFINAVRILPLLRGYDIIHAFDGYPYSIIAGLANIFLRKKIVVTLHGTYALDPFYDGHLPGFYRWALRKADQVIGVSRFTLKAVAEHCSLPRTCVISNGTAEIWFRLPRVNAPAYAPKPYIISVGMIKPQKGFTISLRAYAEVKKNHPDLSYVIVGNQQGRHFAEIKALIEELGLGNCVYFFQNVSDAELAALYDDAEFFILTPVRTGPYVEGFGLVYREAGARGLAVIGSKDCGVEDAVQDGITGLLCAQGDIPGVAGAIEKLLTDKNLRGCMGEAGKKLAQHWTWDKVAEKYFIMYSEVLNVKTKHF